ncbi:PAS domain-containing protein [Streptomyces sp. NBC_01717]|uniref:PAS domain-containing protein n=1 Tax=Streptomyces sp. NBC_01717 TaxID=2975918 RepID=UPI002E30478C|nr:PAS domain-containing protein [Streptomyces sp. NBC_01717]
MADEDPMRRMPAGGDAGDWVGGAILNALFTQSPVGLHVLDTELRVVRVNTATRGMRGVAAEGLLGRHFAEVRVSVARVWAGEKQVTAHGWMRVPGPP